jgi:hypothetical protein
MQRRGAAALRTDRTRQPREGQRTDRRPQDQTRPP